MQVTFFNELHLVDI